VHSHHLSLILFAALALAHPPQEGKDAIALNQRGLEAASRRDFVEAEKYYSQSAGIYRALGPEFEAHLSIELFNLAESLCGQGKWREGDGVFEESLALSRRALGPKHIRTVADLNALSNVSMMLGDAPRAEAQLKEALAIERENYPADLQLAHTLAGLSALRRRTGKLDEALPFAQEALSVALKAEGAEGPESAMMYQNVAQIHSAACRIDRALPLYRKARAILERLGATADPKYASLLSQEGLALMDDGKLGLAEIGMKRAVDLLSQAPAAEIELAVAQNNLGLLRMRQKKYAEADELLTKALSVEQLYNSQDAALISRTRDALEQVRSALR
jgi:tetratricopeptide (TPR) repeat protein